VPYGTRFPKSLKLFDPKISPVVLGALARAQAERGEDGGVQSGETYALYRQSLSDAIALEANRHVEDTVWNWV
jgi:hypothetical protein